MQSGRELFMSHLAPTSSFPIGLEIERAEGVFLFDKKGNKYFDLISGIAVSNTGHGRPEIRDAIKKQVDKNLHLMVYGEYIQSPQVLLAGKLTSLLPPSLDCVYFVNSGSEAIEGALKLAKRVSGRSELISFRNSYHGSTQGSLSICGNEVLKNSYRPLLPVTRILDFNDETQLDQISTSTACVVAEPIQGEAGVILPENDFLKKLRDRCSETGALLIFDEIQTGFGRTGRNFCFEHYKVIPDILCLGKALGGGMPLGAFIASKAIMHTLADNPPLGHITTFGGHPVCCASAIAALEILLDERLGEQSFTKGNIFRDKFSGHSAIKFRGMGLMMAIEFASPEQNKKIISDCLEHGVVSDWFLFNDRSMRIAPPLTIRDEEINECYEVIAECISRSER